MNDFMEIFEEAQKLNDEKESLNKQVSDIHETYMRKKRILDSEHESHLRDIDDALRADTEQIKKQENNDVRSYLNLKNSLNAMLKPVRQEFPNEALKPYTPTPVRLDQSEIDNLFNELRKDDIHSKIKHTFKIDGAMTRENMALQILHKLADAVCYIDRRIEDVSRSAKKINGGKAD
jgi:hypothetical protein